MTIAGDRPGQEPRLLTPGPLSTHRAVRAALGRDSGRAASLSLDLSEQHRRFEADGQWRFTPPTQVLAGFDAALDRFEPEGGVPGRARRYRANLRILVDGMRALAFAPLLRAEVQAPIIVTFRDPAEPAYDFETFYAALLERGFAIYPGKLSDAPAFRAGCIGDVTPEDMQALLQPVRGAMGALSMTSGAPRRGT